jgi:hypothetical protein
MAESISCPVSNSVVNENRVRLTALFVFLLSVSFLVAPNWIVPGLLVIDFFLRGFGLGRYSPLNILSGWVVRKLSIGNKLIDQAPKRFAAQLGFIFAFLLFTSAVFSLTGTGYVIAAVLVLFSFLESALGLCAGCYVYSLTRKIFSRPSVPS